MNAPVFNAVVQREGTNKEDLLFGPEKGKQERPEGRKARLKGKKGERDTICKWKRGS